jgi:peptidoglycan glycosyltransferase
VLFARLGLALGGDALADHITRLSIGRSVDLPVEVASGQVLARGVWTDLLAARTAMGQGEVLVTPLEMALVVAAIANDGMQPAPRLVLAIGDETLRLPEPPRQVLSAASARQLRAILAMAYTAGQGETAQSGPAIAGRAGSAESGLPGAPPHAWFIGFAPAVDPRYAIAVILEHNQAEWDAAAPVAAQVLAQAARTQ